MLTQKFNFSIVDLSRLV